VGDFPALLDKRQAGHPLPAATPVGIGGHQAAGRVLDERPASRDTLAAPGELRYGLFARRRI